MNGWKNTLRRALRTFLQAALAYVVTAVGGGLAGLYDAEGKVSRMAVAGLIIAAVAAGLAALMNLPERAPDVEIEYEIREGGRDAGEDVGEDVGGGRVVEAPTPTEEGETAKEGGSRGKSGEGC